MVQGLDHGGALSSGKQTVEDTNGDQQTRKTNQNLGSLLARNGYLKLANVNWRKAKLTPQQLTLLLLKARRYHLNKMRRKGLKPGRRIVRGHRRGSHTLSPKERQERMRIRREEVMKRRQAMRAKHLTLVEKFQKRMAGTAKVLLKKGKIKGAYRMLEFVQKGPDVKLAKWAQKRAAALLRQNPNLATRTTAPSSAGLSRQAWKLKTYKRIVNRKLKREGR